jgi:hypothetical protein
MERFTRACKIPADRIQIELQMRSDESLTPANDSERECIEQNTPGESFPFKNADQRVYRGVTSVKSFRRVVKRRLTWHSQKAAN